MKIFSLETRAHSQMVNIDALVQRAVTEGGLAEGLAHVHAPHTTAGVTINENADPDVTTDMAMILDRMAPWRGGYAHGEGNSAAHAKASLMGFGVMVPVEKGRIRLGTWQSVYFCEFDGPRTRQVWITLVPGA